MCSMVEWGIILLWVRIISRPSFLTNPSIAWVLPILRDFKIDDSRQSDGKSLRGIVVSVRIWSLLKIKISTSPWVRILTRLCFII